MHDVLRDGVDLIMHLHTLPLPVAHTHQQDPEICSSEIQGQKVSFLWKMNPGMVMSCDDREQEFITPSLRGGGKMERERHLAVKNGRSSGPDPNGPT